MVAIQSLVCFFSMIFDTLYNSVSLLEVVFCFAFILLNGLAIHV